MHLKIALSLIQTYIFFGLYLNSAILGTIQISTEILIFYTFIKVWPPSVCKKKRFMLFHTRYTNSMAAGLLLPIYLGHISGPDL